MTNNGARSDVGGYTVSLEAYLGLQEAHPSSPNHTTQAGVHLYWITMRQTRVCRREVTIPYTLLAGIS